jgi:hypothetical protein
MCHNASNTALDALLEVAGAVFEEVPFEMVVHGPVGSTALLDEPSLVSAGACSSLSFMSAINLVVCNPFAVQVHFAGCKLPAAHSAVFHFHSSAASACAFFVALKYFGSTKNNAFPSNFRSHMARLNRCHNVHESHVAFHCMINVISGKSIPFVHI